MPKRKRDPESEDNESIISTFSQQVLGSKYFTEDDESIISNPEDYNLDDLLEESLINMRKLSSFYEFSQGDLIQKYSNQIGSMGVCHGLVIDYARYNLLDPHHSYINILKEKKDKEDSKFLEKIYLYQEATQVRYLEDDHMLFLDDLNLGDSMMSEEQSNSVYSKDFIPGVDLYVEDLLDKNIISNLLDKLTPYEHQTNNIFIYSLGIRLKELNNKENTHMISLSIQIDNDKEIATYKLYDPEVGEFFCLGEEALIDLEKALKMVIEYNKLSDLKVMSLFDLNKVINEINVLKDEFLTNNIKLFKKIIDFEDSEEETLIDEKILQKIREAIKYSKNKKICDTLSSDMETNKAEVSQSEISSDDESNNIVASERACNPKNSDFSTTNHFSSIIDLNKLNTKYIKPENNDLTQIEYCNLITEFLKNSFLLYKVPGLGLLPENIQDSIMNSMIVQRTLEAYEVMSRSINHKLVLDLFAEESSYQEYISSHKMIFYQEVKIIEPDHQDLIDTSSNLILMGSENPIAHIEIA